MLKNINISSSVRSETIRKITLVLICIMGFTLQMSAQQNIQFTQYIFNTLSVNPAYAGYKEAWYLQAGHRMQWVGMKGEGGAPVTSQISIDGVTDDLSRNVGLGLQMTADQLGVQSATSLYANYAYRIRMDYEDTKRLSLGLAVGVTQYGLDGTKLRFVDADDPLLNLENKYSYIPDVRFGVFYSAPSWFLGFSAMDLLSGDRSNSLYDWSTDSTLNVMRKRHFYLISGMLFNLTNYTKIRPSFMIREDFKGPTNLDLSTFFIFDNRFWVGASYRTGLKLWKKNYEDATEEPLSLINSVAGLLQFQVTDRIRIGYSYDLAINGLISSQSGTHELTFGWVLPSKRKRVLSPRFF